MYGSVTAECAPAAANVKKCFPLLETNFLADHSHFVILKLFEAFFAVDVRDDTGCINHAWAEEPSVEIIATVIVISDLLFVYRLVSKVK